MPRVLPRRRLAPGELVVEPDNDAGLHAALESRARSTVHVPLHAGFGFNECIRVPAGLAPSQMRSGRCGQLLRHARPVAPGVHPGRRRRATPTSRRGTTCRRRSACSPCDLRVRRRPGRRRVRPRAAISLAGGSTPPVLATPACAGSRRRSRGSGSAGSRSAATSCPRRSGRRRAPRSRPPLPPGAARRAPR